MRQHGRQISCIWVKRSQNPHLFSRPRRRSHHILLNVVSNNRFVWLEAKFEPVVWANQWLRCEVHTTACLHVKVFLLSDRNKTNIGKTSLDVVPKGYLNYNKVMFTLHEFSHMGQKNDSVHIKSKRGSSGLTHWFEDILGGKCHGKITVFKNKHRLISCYSK